MKIVSLILARGGSKGIKNKNMKNLCGRPLISYSIDASKRSRVDETWVSTDDKKIKSISLKNDALVIDRPAELATDTSPSEDSLIHFTKNVDFDILVFLQPTSPLLKHTDINNALELMNKYDSIFSGYKDHWLPRWNKNFKAINFDIAKRPRRQDVHPEYVENGALYITKKDFLLKSRLRYSGKIGVYEMPFSRSFQIDNNDDFLLIEKII